MSYIQALAVVHCLNRKNEESSVTFFTECFGYCVFNFHFNLEEFLLLFVDLIAIGSNNLK